MKKRINAKNGNLYPIPFKERNARAWIYKKMNSGVSQSDLLNSVGAFSNKDKEFVKKQKKLSDKQYEKRYTFLEKVYFLLSNERF